ncbi:MAG TPA: RNA polymerase sigma factor [Burkholderiales bacterium]
MALAADERLARAEAAAHAADDELVARLRAGDASAYEPLMRRYNRRLYRVARSILRDDDAAQDAIQEAYVRAFTQLESYRTPGNFGAWLTRIAVNEALMRQRKDRRYTALEGADDTDEAATPLLSAAGTPEELAAGGELRRLIEAAVDRLPDGFRTVFMLRAIEQLSVEETAASLDIPVATVKTRFHRARALMQRALRRHIEAAGLKAFDFDGPRCDAIVANVLERLGVR